MTEKLDPSKEVITQQTEVEQLPTVADLYRVVQTQEGLLDVIQRRNILLEKALPLAVSITKADEWIEMGETMWPRASACEKIMRRFAIRMHSTRIEKTESRDEKGFYYVYTCYATFELPGGIDSLEAVGTSSSRKPFFGRKTEWLQGESGKKEKITHFRPIWQVDEDNILKAARSNCIANGIQDILGIRHLRKEDLLNAGVTGEFPKVDFGEKTGEKRRKQGASKPKEQKENPEAIMDENARKALVLEFTNILDFLISNGQPEQQIFQKYLTFRDGSLADRQIINRFKKNKALRWLESAIKQMKENEDISGLQDFLSQNEPSGEDEIPL